MISLDKKYRYRNGKPAALASIKAGDAGPVLSLTEGGNQIKHHENGLAYWSTVGSPSDYDLIEVLTKVQILDRLSVLSHEIESRTLEMRRLFAELDAEEQP